MRSSKPRDGQCICGVPVSLHFDRNRKLSCEVAARRFRQDELETPDAPAQEALREPDFQRRRSHSFFERRLGGLFHV